MTRVCMAVLGAASAITLAAPLPAQPTAARGVAVPVLQDTVVRAGVALSADSVTVGTPFFVQVRVRAPLGAEVTFPAGPDTTGPVQPLDPTQEVAGEDTAAVDRTARYRLAAWDVGAFTVPLDPVRVRFNGATRELRLDPVTVHVISVLPVDSAQRVPRPPRPLMQFPRPWWIPWLIALLAAALVGLLLWWYLHRRRRRPPAPPVDAFVEAESRFVQIDALGLPEAGEPGRHVALTQEVLREYLARRFPEALPSRTTRELLAALGARREVPHERLAVLLREGDLIKFAARPVTPARGRELGTGSREIVGRVETAVNQLRAAEAAEASTPSRQPRSAA